MNMDIEEHREIIIVERKRLKRLVKSGNLSLKRYSVLTNRLRHWWEWQNYGKKLGRWGF